MSSALLLWQASLLPLFPSALEYMDPFQPGSDEVAGDQQGVVAILIGTVNHQPPRHSLSQCPLDAGKISGKILPTHIHGARDMPEFEKQRCPRIDDDDTLLGCVPEFLQRHAQGLGGGRFRSDGTLRRGLLVTQRERVWTHGIEAEAHGHAPVHLSRMSTVAEIEAAITRLSRNEAEEVREWLEQWIEDQREMAPEFLASIEHGKADLAEGRARTVKP